jgi:hypothetical protein
MAKCANCSREAVYRYVIVEPFGTNYCESDLPSFLYSSRDLGILPAPVEDVVDDAPKSSKKKTTPVVEDAPEEDAPVEEPPVQEPVVDDAAN